MMEESCVCLGSKEIWVFGLSRLFFKISQTYQIFWKTLGFLCFRGIHNSFLSFLAKLGYSRIKIDLSFYCRLYTKRFGPYGRSQFAPLSSFSVCLSVQKSMKNSNFRISYWISSKSSRCFWSSPSYKTIANSDRLRNNSRKC